MAVSKAGHLVLQTTRRRPQVFILLALILLIILYPFRFTLLPQPISSIPGSLLDSNSINAQPGSHSPSQVAAATEITAATLLSRPLSKDQTSIPKIIHQTWFPAGTNMSESARAWVQTVKKHHPDWEYVLWDDESNEALVRKHVPWFLETYKALPKEINRADMARNLYMFIFGGMYADVDTESLRPVEPLFAAHDVALEPHLASLSASSSPGRVQRAFMGRMAHTLDPEGLGAVPNGWMASPPGHPFWLMPVLAVLENPKGDGSVEGMTGPGILGPVIKQYYSSGSSHGGGGSDTLRRQLCHRIQSLQSGWGIFCPEHSVEDYEGAFVREDGLSHSLVLLPREQIYPYSWVDDGDVKACLGAKANAAFDPESCKRRMGVDTWPSYFITYCTHTW